MVAENGHPEPATATSGVAIPACPAGQQPTANGQQPGLSSSDAALLLTLLDTPGGVAHAAIARGIGAERFLVLIANAAARQAIENVRAFAAARRELRADADCEDFIAVLKEVARASTDLLEKRLAATAGLRALHRVTGYSSSADARSRVAGARPTRYPAYDRPWREIRIPRPAHSPWESEDTHNAASLHDVGTQHPARSTQHDPHVGTQHPARSTQHEAALADASPAHGLTRSPAHAPPAPSALPSPSHTPIIAVDVQLAALRTNDAPEPDSGIATLHAFFPHEVGDYALFAERYRDGLGSLLGPADTYTLTTLSESQDRAVIRVAIQRTPQPYAIPDPAPRPLIVPPLFFHLARVPAHGGTHAGCWLNTAVQFSDTS